MRRLLFVYNADTGFFNLAGDIAHKIFSPATYPCQLCAITHGVFSIRKEWAAFVEASPIPLEFLHRNEFLEYYPALRETVLPAVFLFSEEESTLLLSAEELMRIDSVEGLREAIGQGIAI